MAETNPSFVQVAPDSDGKFIRNIQATILVPDVNGALVPTIVQMQVVALVDDQGRVLNPDSALQDILVEQRRTNDLLRLLIEAVS